MLPPTHTSPPSHSPQLAIRGLISMRDAVKSGETGYPHTHVHEASTSAELVEGIEAAAGGSPAAAAAQAADSGLEPKMQVGWTCVSGYRAGHVTVTGRPFPACSCWVGRVGIRCFAYCDAYCYA
jgi:hypothetical protein